MAFSHRIHKSLEIARVAVEEVIGRGDDVARMVFRCLETIENQMTGAFGRAVLEAGILIEAADEEQLVADTTGGLAQVAVAAHRWRGHRLETVGAVLDHE